MVVHMFSFCFSSLLDFSSMNWFLHCLHSLISVSWFPSNRKPFIFIIQSCHYVSKHVGHSRKRSMLLEGQYFPCFKLKRMKGKTFDFSLWFPLSMMSTFSVYPPDLSKSGRSTWKRKPGSWKMCQDGRSARASTTLADGCRQQPVNSARMFGDDRSSQVFIWSPLWSCFQWLWRS